MNAWIPQLRRVRLIDGVVIAALAMLALKGIGFVLSSADPSRLDGGTSDRSPGFARALTHARTNYAPAEPTTTGSLGTKPKEAAAPAETVSASIPAPPLMPSSASERALIERLGERREELQQRSREMEAREKLIQEQERKLDERFGQMKAAEDAQKGAAALRAEGDQAGFKSLVTMYEAMKPKEAARVFDRLPLDILLPVVSQMNARKMSEVMAVMAPEAAEKLTIALARKARGSGPEERVSTAGAALPPGELPALELPAAASKRRAD